jgi:hypothetical protein
MTAGLYLKSCDKHVLAPVVPLCEMYPTSGVLTTLMKILLLLFQTWFFQVLAGSVILYIDLFAAVVLMGHYIAEEMV